MDSLTDIQRDRIAAALLLRDTMDLFPEGVALFDADDRLVLWNSRYAALYPPTLTLKIGMSFREMLDHALRDGHVLQAVGREEEWIADRMAQHIACEGVHEHQISDGRWLSVQERRSPQGWTIGIRSDITALKQREASFRLLFEANPAPMLVFDRSDLRILAANEAAIALYGHAHERFLALTMLDLRPETDRAAYLARVADGSAFAYAGERVWTHLRADGSPIQVLPHARALTLDGRPVCLVLIMDQTERHAAMEELHRVRAFLDSVVEAIPIGVFAKDMRQGGRYVLYNRASEQIVGRHRATVLNRRDADLFGAEEAARSVRQDLMVVRERQLHVFDQETLRRDNGEVRTIVIKKVPVATERDGEIRYVVGIAEDVTEQRRLASRLEHLAHHDALTSLPNRTLLHADLARDGSLKGCALHYIDLDGFKAVNDRLGHKVGDALLCAVAERLRATIRPDDLAVRLGGDEFVVVQRRGTERGAAASCARRLVEGLGAPYRIDGHSVTIGASIGIALAESGQEEADTLLRNADVALYAAKTAGRGGWRIFTPDVAVASLRQHIAIDDLRRALANQEIVLHYRPVVDAAASGGIIGFEALPYWQHPERGVLEAESVGALAEKAGLEGSLALLVLERACRDAAAWPAHLGLLVGIAPGHVAEHGLAEALAEAASGLDPGRVTLAIPEAALIEDEARAAAMLAALRAGGMKVVLDRVGSGKASLQAAAAFAFDGLRTDAGLMAGGPGHRVHRAILKAIAAFAHDLGIPVAITGIETAAQYAFALAEGCRTLEGPLLGGPVLAAAVPEVAGAVPAKTHAA